MHEAALAADLVRRAVEEAERIGAARVARVVVRIGGLSHSTPEAFGSQFAAAATGTPAEGAEIEFVVPGGDPFEDPDARHLVLMRVDLAVE